MLVTNQLGYPLETRTEVKCFFSSEITDGLLMILYDLSYKHLSTPIEGGVSHKTGTDQCA